MEESNAGAADRTRPFEIFDRVISLIASAHGIKFGLLSGRSQATDRAREITEIINGTLANDADKFELLNAIMELMWIYGEARASFALAGEIENKRENAEKAREVRALESQRIDLVIGRHGYRRLKAVPKTQRTAPAIARGIFEAVRVDLQKHGYRPIGIDAVTKRVRRMLPAWQARFGQQPMQDD